jgi:redox-sensitive bicupin YhaK (pirin superfamily)
MIVRCLCYYIYGYLSRHRELRLVSTVLEFEMNIVIHKSDSRGVVNHDWLQSIHTYSFARYQNVDRMGFGKLRVLNDDIVEPSMGFGTHPHENIEIISIPLSGSLRHEDSMGNQHVIQSGEVQIMSAGTGVTHSEFNNSATESVNFLQIWILPKDRDIEPGYDQKRFELEQRLNKLQLIVAPDDEQGAITINQDAYFSLLTLEDGHSIDYRLRNKQNGVYIFMISGSVMLDEFNLETRDGVEVSDTSAITVEAIEKAEILWIETPL